MTFAEYLENATLLVWLGGGIALLFVFRVFSPASLRQAPTRQSSLSIIIVAAVILFYILIQNAILLAALQAGMISRADMEPPPSTQLTGTTLPQTAPATLSATASRPADATVPATAPAADKTVILSGVTALAELITVGCAFLLIRPLFAEKSRGWGLHVSQLPTGVLRGIMGFFVVYPILLALLAIVEQLYSHYGHQITEHPTLEALEEKLPMLQTCILYFSAAVAAPLAEEFIFRGLVQTAIVQYGWGLLIPQFMPAQSIPSTYRPSVLQRCVAIFVASLLFTYLHSLDHAPIIFILSVSLGYLYERTGILWASIALHALFNSTQLALHYFGSK